MADHNATRFSRSGVTSEQQHVMKKNLQKKFMTTTPDHARIFHIPWNG